MRYRKPFVNILNDLISSLTFPVTILKAIQNGDDWVLNCDNVYHAQKGFTISIGGKDYKIKSIEAQDCFDILTVIGADAITATSFTMYSPYFFYGTLVDGGIQLSQIANSSSKTPMIFFRLDETFKETYHNDPEDSHERDVVGKIYFLSQGDDTILNPDAIEFYVEPMKRLSEIFMQMIKDAYSIFEIWDNDYDLNLYAKFGVYSTGKQPAKVWDDDLSGCGMDFKFKILRTQNE